MGRRLFLLGTEVEEINVSLIRESKELIPCAIGSVQGTALTLYTKNKSLTWCENTVFAEASSKLN